MDYEELAKQYGGTTSDGPVPDYAAIAKQFGGTSVEKSTWESFKPYVAPIAHAVGAVGGGIVGAPAGPLGAVAGAGLGYAGSDELMRIADTYFGKKPASETPTNALARVGGNLAEGASFEMGGQLLGKGIGYVGSKVGNFLADMGATNKAAKIVQESVGADKAAAREALGGAGDVLPAQALAGLNLPETQALAASASARTPKPYDSVLAAQKAKTIGELEALAKGGTQTEVRASQDAAKAATNAALIPERDLALRSANTAGEMLPELQSKVADLEGAAAGATDMVRRFMPAGERASERAAATQPVPFMPRLGSAGKYTYMGELEGVADKWASRAADASLDLGNGARFARYAADSLAAHGLHPLESAPLVSGIRNAANDVSFAGNKEVSSAMKEVAQDLEAWTNSGGVIDAFALDAIRKNAVNAAIKRNMTNADPKAQQKAAASILTQVRPLIDDAIEAAGGTGYKAYLKDYALAMQEQARTKLAGKALDLYKTSPDQFVRMVNGDAPKMVEKFLGPGHYDISTELSPDAYATLKRAADGVTRTANMTAQAQRGREALGEIVKQNTIGLKVPFFGLKETAANALLGTLESRLSNATMNKLSTAFQSGKSVDQLLQVVPAGERNSLLRFLNNTPEWLPQTLTGTAASMGGSK